MYNFLQKYNNYLVLLLKLAIVTMAFYFIYQKLAENSYLTIHQLKEKTILLFSNNGWHLVFLLLFTDVNWFLEFYKWKTLVSEEKKINFFEAYTQCLASLTVSIITPNRIGEYGAKVLYFEKESRKKIMTLNLFGNLYQLLITMVLGVFGILYSFEYLHFNNTSINNDQLIKWIFYSLIALIIFLIPNIKKWLFSQIQKVYNYWKELSLKTHLKTIGFSFFRYLTFSHQFYFLLLLLNVEIEYSMFMPLIFSMYFLASIIPSISIFDWAIKGFVALWVFRFLEIDSLTIIYGVTLMWILNFAFPAVLGSIFVLNFKLIRNK